MDISRKILSLLMVMMFVTTGSALAGMPSPPDQPKPVGETKSSIAPKAVFPQLRYEFEPLYEGEDIKHDFVVENHGQAPLVINKVDTD